MLLSWLPNHWKGNSGHLKGILPSSSQKDKQQKSEEKQNKRLLNDVHSYMQKNPTVTKEIPDWKQSKTFVFQLFCAEPQRQASKDFEGLSSLFPCTITETTTNPVAKTTHQKTTHAQHSTSLKTKEMKQCTSQGCEFSA